MIDTPILFNLSDIIEGPEDVMYLALTDPPHFGVPLCVGYPLITSKAAYKKHKERDHSFTVTTVFPCESVKETGRVYSARISQVMVRPCVTPLIENHKVVPTDIFKKSQLESIMEILKVDGGITFLFTEVKEAIISFKNAVAMLESFRHKAAGGYTLSKDGSNIKGDRVAILSFFNLHHAIPIFNERKARGIGMVFRIVDPERSIKMGKLSELASAFMVAADHRDNLIVVDGVAIRSEGSLPSGLYEHFESTLAKQREKEKPKKADVSADRAVEIKFTTYASTSSTSSTTSW